MKWFSLPFCSCRFHVLFLQKLMTYFLRRTTRIVGSHHAIVLRIDDSDTWAHDTAQANGPPTYIFSWCRSAEMLILICNLGSDVVM